MKRSRLGKKKQEQLIEHFVVGTMVSCAAELTGINRETAAYYFHRLREIIYQATEDETLFAGEIEVDESYFGGWRKGMRGRGAAGKVPVLELLKRGGGVYARVIPDAKGKTPMRIMENKIVPDSIVYSDSFSSYSVLDVSDFKHSRINHSELFADGRNRINGIENFWNQAKWHMRKFNGVLKDHFSLFLRSVNGISTTQIQRSINTIKAMV